MRACHHMHTMQIAQVTSPVWGANYRLIGQRVNDLRQLVLLQDNSTRAPPEVLAHENAQGCLEMLIDRVHQCTGRNIACIIAHAHVSENDSSLHTHACMPATTMGGCIYPTLLYSLHLLCSRLLSPAGYDKSVQCPLHVREHFQQSTPTLHPTCSIETRTLL